MVYAIVASIAVLALLGAAVSYGILSSRSRGNVPAQTFKMTDDIPVSFGAMAVVHADITKGLTARDLAGMTHGIGDFVGEDGVLAQVSVTISNLEDRAVSYSPEMFTMRAAGKEVPVANSNIPGGVLEPSAAIDMRLGFAVPKEAGELTLVFNDREGGDKLVAVGSTSDAKSGAGGHGVKAPHGSGTGHDH
jgi:hypothetical protein